MKNGRSKIVLYSFTNYAKNNLVDSVNNELGAMDINHKKILGEETYNILVSFNESYIES